MLWDIESLASSRGAIGTRPLDHRDERLTTLVGVAHFDGKADAYGTDALGRVEAKVKAETVNRRHFRFGNENTGRR